MVLILLPLTGLASGGEQNGNQYHGRNQEDILAKDHQAQHSGYHTHNGREVVFVGKPLLCEERNKQRSQDEFNTLKADRDEVTGNRADHTACHPVKMVQQGDKETVGVLFHAFRGLILCYQGVSLVGKGENQIGLFLAGVLIGIDQRDAVENVPGIQQENGDSRGQNRGVACQETDGQKLSGACVHEQGHGKGPGQAVTSLS